jgi:hypothetical protein
MGACRSLLAGLALLSVFAALAVVFGAETRDGYGDDHARVPD